MRSTDPSVSPAALSLVLNALETSFPITRRSLSKDLGLGLSTVTRALSTCVSYGILTCEAGTDPESGRPCRAYVPTKGLLLPLLTLSHGSGAVRVLDTSLSPARTAVTELHPSAPPEEAARILSHRLLTMLRGCTSDENVVSPVLLADSELPVGVLQNAVTHTLGKAPLAVISPEDGIARAMRHSHFPREVTSMLFLSVGESSHACLLLRSETDTWSPSPLGRGLSHSLTRALRGAEPSSEGVVRVTAVFLTDLCRFLTPDLIYVEDPRGLLPDKDFFLPLLPDGMEILVDHAPRDLILAEYGAALAGRRMVWDKILSL